MQDMAAALLRAMGYFTPFVTPKGKDGGSGETLHSNPHIEIIDLEQLIELWEDHYDKLEVIDKIIMPLIKISFLTPTD